MPLQKLKNPIITRFSSKVIMFEETLEFEQAVIICYGEQKTITWQQRVPKAQVWAINISNHMMPKPCGHNLWNELVMWSLPIIWCFNYYHYPNYQAINKIDWNGASFRWDKGFGSIWLWTHLLPKKDEGRSCEGF